MSNETNEGVQETQTSQEIDPIERDYLARFCEPVKVIGDSKLKPAGDGVYADFAAYKFGDKFVYNEDLSIAILQGFLDYVKDVLGGGVRCLGPNYWVKEMRELKVVETPEGRTNKGLYYERYNLLNQRMHKTSGNLTQAAKFFSNLDNVEDSVYIPKDSSLSVIPVNRKDSLSLIPGFVSTIYGEAQINSKLIREKDFKELLERLRATCELKCISCELTETCPIYRSEELAKTIINPTEYLNLYIKDNRTDMIYYGEDSPSITDGSFDSEKLKEKHLPYREIVKIRTNEGDKDIVANIRRLEGLREEINSSVKVKNQLASSLDWLEGARYGTISGNDLKKLSTDEDIKNSPDYKYFTDAVFLEDSTSYFKYDVSNNKYEVTVPVWNDALGKYEEKKGTTQIYLPRGFLAETTEITDDVEHTIDTLEEDDDVYLVSDDKPFSRTFISSDGKRIEEKIKPIVYLGKKKDLYLNFYIEEDPSRECLFENDDKIYAKDVAQFSMNCMKGSCAVSPIGDFTTTAGGDIIPLKDALEDRDQYWMNPIYKKVDNKYIKIAGRERELSGRSEPLVTDVSNLNRTDAFTKTLIAQYCNFLRKVGIRIYDKNGTTQNKETGENIQGRDTIRWVHEKVNPNPTFRDIENKKYALTQMKENLRLVFVHCPRIL